MHKLSTKQKEIIKQNWERWMSTEYIANLLWFRFPGFKSKFKKQIETYIKNELEKNLTKS